MKKNIETSGVKEIKIPVSAGRSILYILIAVLLIALDQFSKAWVLKQPDLMQGGERALIPNMFSLRYTFNTGAAWSFLADKSWGIYLLTGISALAALAFLILLIKHSAWPALFPVSLTLVLAGTVGNLIDRAMLGGVVDFFDYYRGSWHFPTFNVADSLIVVGVILLLIFMLFFEEKHKAKMQTTYRNKVRTI